MASTAGKHVRRKGKKKSAASVVMNGNGSILPPKVAEPPPNPGKRRANREEGNDDDDGIDEMVQRIEMRRKRTKGLLGGNEKRRNEVRNKRLFVCTFSLRYLLTRKFGNTKTHCY